jgi:hypothetical protein
MKTRPINGVALPKGCLPTAAILKGVGIAGPGVVDPEP